MTAKTDDTKTIEAIAKTAKRTKGESDALGAAIDQVLNLMQMIGAKIDVIVRKALQNAHQFGKLLERLQELGAAALEKPAAMATAPVRAHAHPHHLKPSLDS